jgi:hypothetical protein
MPYGALLGKIKTIHYKVNELDQAVLLAHNFSSELYDSLFCKVGN